MSPLIQLVFAILIVGVLVWAIDQLPGIDATFKQVAKVILIVVLVIWALTVIFGMFGYAPLGRLGAVR